MRKNGGLFSTDSGTTDEKPGGSRTASQPIPVPRSASPAIHRRKEKKVHEKVLQEGPGGSWKLVQMTEDHVDDVLRIQRECYEPEYREDRQRYIDRIHLYPEGNVALFVPEPTTSAVSPSTPPSPSSPAASKRRKKHSLRYVMAGYILLQPFYRGAVNDVNDVKEFSKWIAERDHLPRTETDCIYVHEISVHPDFRGQGLTMPLTQYAETLARGDNFKWLSLVALGPALGFWKRTGYTLEREIDYAGHACYYMEKESGLP